MNNNSDLQILKKCYICDEATNNYCKNIFQQHTKHSETIIYKLLEKFLTNIGITLENNLNYDENRNIICQKCLLKLDEYDLAILSAQRIEYELTQLLIHTKELYENANNKNSDIIVAYKENATTSIVNKIFLDEQYIEANNNNSDNNKCNGSIVVKQEVDDIYDYANTDYYNVNNNNVKNVDRMNNSNDQIKMITGEKHKGKNLTARTRKSKKIVNDKKTSNNVKRKPKKPESQSNAPPTYKCSRKSCENVYQNKMDLRNHLKTHKQVICHICGKIYKIKYDLNMHIVSHQNIARYECDICGKKLKRRGALVKHMAMHIGESKYQCDKCGKQFIHYSSFSMHKLFHDDIREKKCTLCELAFRTNSHLKIHMLTHTGEKPHACPTCGKTFAKRCNMTAHFKAHLGIYRVYKKSHICSICNTGFTRPALLKDHMVAQHRSTASSTEILSSLMKYKN